VTHGKHPPGFQTTSDNGMPDRNAPHEDDADLVGLARFFHRAGHLKALPRTGWLHCDVPPGEVESVADHAFRTTLMAWLAAADVPGIDRDKVLKLALVHDLAEALAGDPTPYDPSEIAALDPEARRAFLNRRQIRGSERQAAKHAAETAAMLELLAGLHPDLATEVRSLWDEVEGGTTREARFVKSADRLERYLQAREYGAADPTLPLGSFTADIAETIDDPTLLRLRNTIATLTDEDLADR
jgi:putative hydrolase of HD superfamily